jgi:hypothetical protein
VAELVALVIRRTRWTPEYIRTLDRAFLTQIVFHPENERGELDLQRPEPNAPRGDPIRRLMRQRGWPDHLIEARLAGRL